MILAANLFWDFHFWKSRDLNKKLKKIIQNMVFLWAPIYITRQPGYQIQIRFEMWRDLNCECLFIRTNLIVHKGNGAEISEFSKGFVRRVKWKGPLNWIDHQKSLQFLTAVSSCLLPYFSKLSIIRPGRSRLLEFEKK